ncbi:MAG: helix-turn-helix transcriptional regulator [Eubacteriales bacterium]|nr:helix-turn-helix transcriptional regulator [Eubacteriales bacterium]
MKILILTQNLQDLRLLQKLLEIHPEEEAEIYLEWNPKEAEQILKRQEMDIVICEASLNGQFDLLKKFCCQEDHPELIALFKDNDGELLSQLEELPGIFFLKSPVEREKAERILELAKKQVVKKQYVRKMERYNHYRESHKRMIQNQFWMRFCSGQISLDPSSFIKEAENAGVAIELGDIYQIGVLSRKLIRDRNTEIEKKTRTVLLDFANKWFKKSGAEYFILEQLRPLLIVRNMPKEEFLYQCKGLIREIYREAEMPLCIYYDADIYCEKIFSSVLSIMAAEKEDMEDTTGIYPASQFLGRKREEIDVLLPGYTEEFLRTGHYNQVLKNIREFLQEQNQKGRVSGSYLRALRIDMSQTIFHVLAEKGVPAHKLLMTPRIKELEINAHISIDSFLEWLEEVMLCMPEQKPAVSLSEAVQNFVREHVRENITRETIAEALYMNADYLGRLYKRETGQSLGNLIMEEKMKEACRLLTSTTRSVGEISAELGYENFSHFSKIFKKVTGCTPKEYRVLAAAENFGEKLEKRNEKEQ